MTCLPFSWLWGDPAETLDRKRSTMAAFEKADKEMREIERRKKARRIRKLVKMAKARQLKGQA
jgi:hypothetical protein